MSEGEPAKPSKLNDALNDYRLAAGECPPDLRDVALRWWRECDQRRRATAPYALAERRYHEARSAWEKEHPKPPLDEAHDADWLELELLGRNWDDGHPSPLRSRAHLRGKGLVLRSVRSWALSNPAPKLVERRVDGDLAGKATRALLDAARSEVEHLVWHEERAQWCETHREPPPPPSGSASDCLTWHLASHAWRDEHPHPGETEADRAERQTKQVWCEAFWRRVSMRYP